LPCHVFIQSTRVHFLFFFRQLKAVSMKAFKKRFSHLGNI